MAINIGSSSQGAPYTAESSDPGPLDPLTYVLERSVAAPVRARIGAVEFVVSVSAAADPYFADTQGPLHQSSKGAYSGGMLLYLRGCDYCTQPLGDQSLGPWSMTTGRTGTVAQESSRAPSKSSNFDHELGKRSVALRLQLLAGATFARHDAFALDARSFRKYYPNMDPTQYLRAATSPPMAQRASAYASTAISSLLKAERLLPDSVDRLVPEGRDLLQRLLQPDPKDRLRSLLQLERIALYQHYRWEDVRNMKISPRDLFDDECLTEVEDVSFLEF
uniref:Protein kinase domain-containing protein n=1 Tax=Anopheles maculatus TaxID=74869 RepID=A0A182ST68_9DIPT